MNENDSIRGWYEPGGGTPESHICSEPANAEISSSPKPPRRFAGARIDCEEQKSAPPASRRRTYRTAGVIFLVLVLIVSSALAFSGKKQRAQAPLMFGNVPVYPPEDIKPDDFDDYHEYFEHYYTGTEKTGIENSMPKTEARPGLTLTLKDSSGDELSLSEIYEKCLPSIVGIAAYVDEARFNWATGIIFSSDGYILTNAHVLDGVESITVVLWDGTRCESELVAYDFVSDIAVLKINAKKLTPAEFADSSDIAVGDRVAAIGNPLGEKFSGTMTDGIVSAIDRDMDYGGHSMTLLQTNAAINEGNSGGPLVNMSGQVIGITTMKMMSYFSSIEGIGFAIPTGALKLVVDSLIDDGRVVRAAIGITVGEMSGEASEHYNLPKGLYITSVSPGSDAAKKGILAGDVLTAIDGVRVETTAEVRGKKDKLGVGDSVRLTLFRNGEYFEAVVTLVDSETIN